MASFERTHRFAIAVVMALMLINLGSSREINQNNKGMK